MAARRFLVPLFPRRFCSHLCFAHCCLFDVTRLSAVYSSRLGVVERAQYLFEINSNSLERERLRDVRCGAD